MRWKGARLFERVCADKEECVTDFVWKENLFKGDFTGGEGTAEVLVGRAEG